MNARTQIAWFCIGISQMWAATEPGMAHIIFSAIWLIMAFVALALDHKTMQP